MVNEIKSAAEATKIATSFLKQYFGFLRPLSASRDDGTWVVKVDVGILGRQIAEVQIDAMTSDVKKYSLPEQGI